MRQVAIWTTLLFVTVLSSCDNKRADSGSGAAAACTDKSMQTQTVCVKNTKCGWDNTYSQCKNASDIQTTNTTSSKACNQLTVAECSMESSRCQVKNSGSSQYCDTYIPASGGLGLNCSTGYPPNCPAGCVSAPVTIPGSMPTQCIDPALAGAGGYSPGYYPYPSPPSVMPQVLLGGALGAIGGLLSGGPIGLLTGGIKGALGALSSTAGTVVPGSYPAPYTPYTPYMTPPPTTMSCSAYTSANCPPTLGTIHCMPSGSMCVQY